jgi:Protein of unknown function (DUF1194)
MRAQGWLALAMLAAAAPAEAGCRLALAIGLDVSGSVDRAEKVLLMEGMAAALLSPSVQAAMLDMPESPVRIAVYEWSGARSQRVLVPWVDVTGPEVIGGIAEALRARTEFLMPNETALGVAAGFGLDMLGEQGTCARHVLDIAGDGPNNLGPEPSDVLPQIVPGVTVNALAIGGGEPQKGVSAAAELADYYARNLIRGPDAFVEIALDFADFRRAMEKKLLREIVVNTAGLPGAPALVDVADLVGPEPFHPAQ